MKQNPESIQAFREWTRGTSFMLAMGKTQVATLVCLHASKDLEHHIGVRHKALRWFIPAVRGLQERGLVVHHPWAEARPVKYGEIFEITQAGGLVVALLKISGIYEELHADFLRSDGVKPDRVRELVLRARREVWVA